MKTCFLSTPALKFNASADDPTFGSDVVLLDLEDSIHISAKSEARRVVAEIDLRQLASRGYDFGIRINCITSIDGIRDLDVVYQGCETGKLAIEYLHIPKVKSHHDVLLCRSVIEDLPTKLKIFPLIETPEAVEDVDAIAAVSDIMMFGETDMSLSMYRPNAAYLDYARARFCVACARECIPAIDTKGSTDLSAFARFEAECVAAKDEGFTGKSIIHPKQIPVARKVFSVPTEELRRYRESIGRYKESQEGFTIVDGQIVAPPFIAHAERMLKLYEG